MIDTSAGFVAIPRGITSWEWYDDPNTCRLFFHLMLTVNYQSKEWRGIAIEAGGRVASLSILAEETGLTVRNVRTSLERLEATSYVTIKKTNKYSIVTINNYMSLTGIDKLNDKQATRKTTSKRHAKRQANDTQNDTQKSEISDVPSLENCDSDFCVTRKTTRSPNESRTKNDTQNDNNHTKIQDTSNISSPPPTPSSGAGPEKKTTTAAKSPEDYWRGCGYRLTLPAREAFQGWREKGMEDELIITAIREAGVHEAKSPLAYIRPILDRAAAAGQLTLAAWQAAHPPGCSPGGKRVDRPEPSGNDFLADAVSRPRRHKRQD